MLAGTVGAFINPFARQVFVSGNITLSAQQLNGVIIVDNSGGPVTVTLPPAVSIRAGGYFQVLALTDANPVTVVVQGGDFYNANVVAPIILTTAGQILTIFATNTPNLWGIPLSVGAACCAPTLVPSWVETAEPGIFGLQQVTIPLDIADIPVSINVHCVDPGATVAFKVPGLAGAVGPVVTNVVVQPPPDPIAPATLIFDVSTPVGTTVSPDYHILVTNPCGCCGIWPGPVSVVP